MPTTAAQVAQAVVLSDQGSTQREVAALLNVPRTTLRRAFKRYQKTGLYTRRPGNGRLWRSSGGCRRHGGSLLVNARYEEGWQSVIYVRRDQHEGQNWWDTPELHVYDFRVNMRVQGGEYIGDEKTGFLKKKKFLKWR